MILTRDVRVDYDGVTAVRDLSLEIPAGEVYGLIGPNGAGKTSTIRVLATLQRPTYGEVFIGGVDLAHHPSDAHRILGYMPDNPPVYGDLRCWEFLDLFGAAYFVTRRERRRRIDELIDQLDLQTKRRTLARTLSTGMKQRLVLAKTLLPDPQVLLLDEPASGLDPHARIELRDLLLRQAEQGKTILVSSHILTELSEFCSSIGIMVKGELKVSGRIDEVIDTLNTRRRYIVQVVHSDRDAAALLRSMEEVVTVDFVKEGIRIDLDGLDRDASRILKRLVEADIPVKGFFEQRMGVEDIFMKVGAREVS